MAAMPIVKGATTTQIVYIHHLSCGECGATIALDDAIYERADKEGRTFYCPNGHPRCFTETALVRAQKEAGRLAVKLGDLRFQLINAQQDANRQERRARALKGVVTKVKAKIASGHCPCCEKKFQDVARHMALAHPEFSPDDPNDEKE